MPPFSLVEVDREEKALLVKKKGVNTGDEGFTMGDRPGQMPTNDIVGHRKESTVRALGTLDARLLADLWDPLIRARWCIAGATGPPALKSARIDVFPPSK